MMEHDPLCPLGKRDTTHQSWGFVECRCDEYAKVRADEQERLRGKVEALPHGLARNGAVCAFVYFEGQQPCNCHKATFLALLGGESE